MAQEYYSFMINRFFETLFIQLMASVQSSSLAGGTPGIVLAV